MGTINETKYWLNKLGYSLFEIDEKIDITTLIIDTIKTKDLKYPFYSLPRGRF